jgi:hypothetical protein
MADARRRRGQGGEQPPEQPAGGAYRPDAFDEPEGGLPTEVPPEEEEEEYLSIESPEMLAIGARPPMEQLLSAHAQLEERLILNVSEQALVAEAGTDDYGPENIVGVGISEKIVGNRLTDEPCIAVYVVAKKPRGQVATDMLVPEAVDGIPTDVVETGELRRQPFKGRYRPAPGGVSVGHFKITAGTLGCLVTKGRALYILSNNHVLADSNKGKIGDPILQPGPIDGGKVPADVIAKLSQFVPIKFGGAPNQVDCAIAQTSPTLVTPLDRCYGKIGLPPVACRLNLLVKKCGRTTQFTRGRITDCNATVRVSYGTSGTAVFQQQIIVVSLTAVPFSQGGDSGSLIVTDTGNRPVGLLFAGSATHTIANPIAAVLGALGVTIVT